jgi:regulator of sigma E protease
LQPGDEILSVAGRDTPTFDDIRAVVVLRPGETVPVSFERRGQVHRVQVTLKADTEKDTLGNEYRRGLLGVYPTLNQLQRVPVLHAVPLAVQYTASLTRTIGDGLVQLIRGQVSPRQLGGPITIARVAGQGAELGPLPFVQLLALLSINLGFINLLPVPMLDGGHLFFYAIEAVRRRPISARALDWAFRGGLAVILTLLLFTTINDLASLELWDRLQRLIG